MRGQFARRLSPGSAVGEQEGQYKELNCVVTVNTRRLAEMGNFATESHCASGL